MENKYTVLFIDDDCEVLHESLEPAISKNNFILYDAVSPEKGKELLDSYSNVIDAVLLDLGYSNSGIQGIDFLNVLRENYPELPVVILTGSDSAENIRTAVECLNIGAVDYFGKTRLDPFQLFNRLTEIIESGKTKKIHNSMVRKISIPDDSGIVSSKFISQDSEIYYSHFIYSIEAIKVAVNMKDEDYLSKGIYVWHKDVLSLVSLLKQDVSVSLRFQSIQDLNRRMNLYIIFSVKGNTEVESLQNAGLVSNEVGIMFTNMYTSALESYNIIRLKDKERIKNILHPVNQKRNIRFFTKENRNLDVRDDSMEYIPNEKITDKILNSLILQRDIISSYERLMKFLNNSEEKIYFEILLQPAALSIENLEYLKYAANNYTNISDYTEKSFINGEIYKFIESPKQVYNTFIFAYSENGYLPENINMAVGNDLFLGSSNFKTEDLEINPVHINPDMLNDLDNSNNICDVYSFANTLRLFHPPFPLIYSHSGFEISDNEDIVEFPKEGPILGKIKSEGEEKIIRISPDDLLKHIYITGQTGTGKTTMLYSMIMERIYSGNGIAVIDPHGDLINDIIDNIPDNRKNDIIFFNPVDENNNIFINLIEYEKDKPEQKSFIINEILKLLNDIYDLKLTGGPIFEQYFRNTLLIMMSDEYKQYTIMDVVKFLHDETFRSNIIADCDDEELITFWESAKSAYGEASLKNVIPYISSKLTFFSDNHYINRIISKNETSINFREILDKNKILLVNLSKGKLGSMNTVFLGRILFNKLLMAAYSREDIPENERKDFTVFIDEFHNFVSSDLESAMSEVRKYHIALVLANQTLSQLSSSILASVVGNAGSHIFFRQGINDVYKLTDLYSAKFTVQQVLNLSNYTCIGRILNNNRLLMPLLLVTISKEEIIKIIS